MKPSLKISAAFCLLVFTIACNKGNSFYETSVNPVLGNLTRDGTTGPLFITNAFTTANSNGTVTLSFVNNLRTPIGGGTRTETVQQIIFRVPTNQLGTAISLDTSSAQFQETPPLQTNPSSPVMVAFTSTQATGTLTLNSFFDDPALLNPDHGNGFFEVTFRDGLNNVRQITNGYFNY